MAAIELGTRSTLPDADTPQVNSPQAAYDLVAPMMAHEMQENLRILILDTKNRVVANHLLYKGSLNTSVVRIGALFTAAIQNHAAGIIIAHNHPSGDATPSPEDVKVTRQIISAGKLLDIDVLDHIVIGQGHFVSLQERGLAFG